MSIKQSDDWTLSERGKVDARRHREKVKEAIRENIAEIISDASIITRKKGEVVRVPIRGIKSYEFRHGHPDGGGVGMGQGEGEAGDIIGRRPKKNGRPGQAGDQPGVDFLETEIDIEELIEMMMNDLGLPNIKQKEVIEKIIGKDWKIYSVEKHGIPPRMHRRRTIRESIKSTIVLIVRLMRATGAPQAECESALKEAGGDVVEAEELLKKRGHQNPLAEDATLSLEALKVSFIGESDKRFNVVEEDVEEYSNAVILAMMDVSGSMNTIKKYLARSFFFWLTEFLKKLYKRVEIRFIAHTTEAKLVDENEFFHKGESGGTFCHTAYDLAGYLVETEYNPKRWNIYSFHVSDGEDFEAGKTVQAAENLLNLGINMLGYLELQVEQYVSSNLMLHFRDGLGLREEREEKSLKVFVDHKGKRPFIGLVIESKEQIWSALSAVLKKSRKLE